jgi:hypothetical protein
MQSNQTLLLCQASNGTVENDMTELFVAVGSG